MAIKPGGDIGSLKTWVQRSDGSDVELPNVKSMKISIDPKTSEDGEDVYETINRGLSSVVVNFRLALEPFAMAMAEASQRWRVLLSASERRMRWSQQWFQDELNARTTYEREGLARLHRELTRQCYLTCPDKTLDQCWGESRQEIWHGALQQNLAISDARHQIRNRVVAIRGW